MAEGASLIDSHCHLDHFDAEERSAILERAAAAGIEGLLTISTRLPAAETVRALAGRSPQGPRVWCTVGTHPEYAGEDPLATADAIIAATDAPDVVGIGESGLDTVVASASAARQEASFRAHIEAARRTRLPLVIHARGADDEVAAILADEAGRGRFDFVMHCFSSGEKLADAALALGGYVSFSGIMTFPKADALRVIARSIPDERLLVETDAPFLAPVPRRGQRNEPAYVAHTAALLASLRGVTPDALASLTTRNFRRLFRRAA